MVEFFFLPSDNDDYTTVILRDTDSGKEIYRGRLNLRSVVQRGEIAVKAAMAIEQAGNYVPSEEITAILAARCADQYGDQKRPQGRPLGAIGQRKRQEEYGDGQAIDECQPSEAGKDDLNQDDFDFPLNDVGNAKRLIKRHGGRIRYCGPWGKWLYYDGRRWAVDDVCYVQSCAQESARSIYEEVEAKAHGSDQRRSLAKWARQSENSQRIAGAIKQAESLLGVIVRPEELDSDPFIFNAANGTIDLRDGKFRPHDSADMLTKISPVNYDEKASADVWEEFLSSVFGSDESIVEFCWKLFGYFLTGDVREDLFVIFWGAGSNGKSVLTKVLTDILGDYSFTAPSTMLLEKQGGEQHPTAMASLHGRRLVLAAETGEGARLNEPVVKSLTGRDRISARRMREDFWNFDPTHKLAISTNHKPIIRGTDTGIWRRIRLIPFTRTFWNGEQSNAKGPDYLQADKNLASKLRDAYPAILAWMVRGCLEWQETGLAAPLAVRESGNTYRGSQDVLGAFLDARCVLGGNDFRVKASQLYAVYSEWARENGEYVRSQRVFGESLTERGITRISSNGTWYCGISVKAEDF